jgi:hypothetical protein
LIIFHWISFGERGDSWTPEIGSQEPARFVQLAEASAADTQVRGFSEILPAALAQTSSLSASAFR